MFVAMMMQRMATQQMHNAQFAMMQNRANLMATCRNLPTFGNNISLGTLAKADAQLAINNDTNATMYMIASAQKKAAEQMITQDIKNNKISYIA